MEKTVKKTPGPKDTGGRKGKPTVTSALLVLSIAVFVFSAGMLVIDWAREAAVQRTYLELADKVEKNIFVFPAAELAPAEPVPQKSPLEEYLDLWEQYPEMVGWLKIPETRIDYPVMFTGDDFYLSHGIDKKKSRAGVPFVDRRCTVAPFGANTIIYGHNMRNGTMFSGLEKYRDEDYGKGHKLVYLYTPLGLQEYGVFAAFESRIFGVDDPDFKHYDFLGVGGKAEFEKYIANVRGLSLYSFDASVSYGDELLTLVTCSYHTKRGQFVLVAKKVRP